MCLDHDTFFGHMMPQDTIRYFRRVEDTFIQTKMKENIAKTPTGHTFKYRQDMFPIRLSKLNGYYTYPLFNIKKYVSETLLSFSVFNTDVR